jgi:phosphoribosylglycinamide formyltransferase-1
VNEDYDEGGVIFQKKIILTGSESAEDIAESIHELKQYFRSNVG